MELTDSRRLTGPNLLWDHPGAVLEVALSEGEDATAVIREWRTQVRLALHALGLPVELIEREYPLGVSLAVAAPIDVLYTATTINEWAFENVRRVLSGEPAHDIAGDRARLLTELEAERDPKLLALADAAQQRGLNFCGDDEWTTIGMGRHGQTWATPELPSVEQVNWKRLGDVPCALVTGTNGKTTTVRLLSSIVTSAGLTFGASSTDWIRIGDDLLDKDDWSGPGGARAVIKDKRVDVALLETARGGLLRRGLAIPRADVGIITNVAHDHMGEMGVHCLADLTDVKFVIHRAAQHLVLNADNPEVRRKGQEVDNSVTWVSLSQDDSLLEVHRKKGGATATLESGELVFRQGPTREGWGDVGDIPITMGGAARYNVTNALCAAAAARVLGVPQAAIQSGLASFESDAETNPGRLNEFELGGVRALVDFAHNPHGMEAIFELVSALPHSRSVVLLGQAGDRDDAAIVALAEITAKANPDLVIIKQMTQHLRGRKEGDVTGMIGETLRAHGMRPDQVQQATSELEAARSALQWARDGDLLLLLCHAERAAVLELLSTLQASAWKPGQALPAISSGA